MVAIHPSSSTGTTPISSSLESNIMLVPNINHQLQPNNNNNTAQQQNIMLMMMNQQQQQQYVPQSRLLGEMIEEQNNLQNGENRLVSVGGNQHEEQYDIQQVISNFKLRPLRAYQQEQERMENHLVSSPTPANIPPRSTHPLTSRSVLSSPLNPNIPNPYVSSVPTTVINTNPNTTIPTNQSIVNPLSMTYNNNEESDDHQGLLGSFEVSTDSNKQENHSLKSYMRKVLLVFHIICQVVMSIMIGTSFFLYDWKAMIIFTPKIIIGFLIILAVYKKKNGFLHFLLGSVLLDLIYTTILVCLRFYVTARPGQVTVLADSNSLSSIGMPTTENVLIHTPEWTHSSVEWIKTATPIPNSYQPNEHTDTQVTSSTNESQRKKLPGLWFQFGIQIIGGFIVTLTIVWTLVFGQHHEEPSN